MALKKKPVTGMKDILPKEMAIRDYVIRLIQGNLRNLRLYLHGDPMRGAHRKPEQQTGRRE